MKMMSTVICKRLFLSGLNLVGYTSLAAAQVSFGEPQLFNKAWKFVKGDDVRYASPDYSDQSWRTVDLPHDWSVEGPLSPDQASCTGYLPGGIGWYRKTFQLPADSKGKQVYVYFEGVYRNGEVYINGHSLGMRPNGYISYMYELTPYLKEGANVLAVRVDHSESADSRWYTGSGIYRDVYLITANPIHIDQWGVSYTTPSVSERQATVSIDTRLTNSTKQNSLITVVQEWLDHGKVIAKSVGKLQIKSGETASLTQSLRLNHPHLWSLESPYLYELRTSLYQGKQLVDATMTKAGIRWLTFDSDKGFALNGKNIKIKGVCLHHDAGCLGAAMYRDVWYNRLVTLKQLGVNAIRTSHNPQAPVFYDLCDELGLLVMNEAFDEWEFPKKKWITGWNQGKPGFQGPASFFEAWGEKDLRDMVLRDRNHPCVFMWSIGNEVDYPNDPYSHPILDKEGIQQQHTKGYQPQQPDANRLGVIAKRLAAVVRSTDPSRPVTAALAGPVMSNETEYPGALDVVGYNYTENRYAQDHAKYPKRVFYGSENGHSYDAWKAVIDNDYIFGQFLWTGIDYLGEAFAWPSRGFNSGLLDLAGFIKPRGYFRQSLWSNTPMVYIGTTGRFREDDHGNIDALPLWNYETARTVRVFAYTNCEEASLYLNGQQVGNPKSVDKATGVIYWDIPYSPGKLEAVAKNKGKEAARFALQTSGRPAALTMKADRNEMKAGRDVVELTVQVVDEQHVPVFLSDNEVICQLKGPARLLGIENGDPTDMGNYLDNRQRVYQGRLKIYIQSTGQPGEVTVTCRSQWLKDASVVLSVK
jgi:hypothetical protein